MLHRHIFSQLINFPEVHVSMRMKFFCIRCEKIFLSGNFSSRRWLRGNDLNAATSMDETRFKSCAQILWDYLRIDNPLRKSDLILVLGNSDLRTADYAAKLYREGFAPLVVVSGKEGHHTKGKWNRPEAVVFAETLMKNNVPSESILLEPKATNTGENIRFTQKLLQDHPDNLQPGSIILIQTPFMGRRCLATFLKQWQNAQQVDLTVSSPPVPLEKYPNEAAGYSSLTDVAVEMVRNMQRIQQYPRRGFQVPQDVPPHVLEAYRQLQSLLRGKNM